MINLLAGQDLQAVVSLALVGLAQATTGAFDKAGIGAAILLTLIGMVLHWHAPQLRISLEERLKDGKVTDQEARRRMRVSYWCETIATIAGIALLLAVLFDLTR